MGDLQGEGTAFLVFHSNINQRTGLFCSSPCSPALPAALWHLSAPSSTECRVLPDPLPGDKTPCYEWERVKN